MSANAQNAPGQQASSSRNTSPVEFSAAALTAGARATLVNRTRRVVREQALGMQSQRQKTRSLWVPMAICSALLLVLCYAVWAVLDGYDLTPNGVPDASDQMMLLVIWALPMTVVVLGLVWFSRGRHRLGSEVRR